MSTSKTLEQNIETLYHEAVFHFSIEINFFLVFSHQLQHLK